MKMAFICWIQIERYSNGLNGSTYWMMIIFNGIIHDVCLSVSLRKKKKRLSNYATEYHIRIGRRKKKRQHRKRRKEKNMRQRWRIEQNNKCTHICLPIHLKNRCNDDAAAPITSNWLWAKELERKKHQREIYT